jgi:hypothetical protein
VRVKTPSVLSSQLLGADEGPADGTTLGTLVGPADGLPEGATDGPAEGTVTEGAEVTRSAHMSPADATLAFWRATVV